MSNVRRVLWIDDVKENEANSIFVSNETRIVSTMDEALDEIMSDRLYEYDTIVLDIDFSNGLKNSKQVIQRLKSHIYLSPEQENNTFIIENGGYLLYLFLLEQGYPSNRIAFLTGNKNMIKQLKQYAASCEPVMSPKEITDAFIKAYDPQNDDCFFDTVESMPIHSCYKDSDFTNDCADRLEAEDFEGLKKLILKESSYISNDTGRVKNTGDLMIERFHQANIESPVYFSKKTHSIYGHNKTDAEQWLLDKRSYAQVARWLFLYISHYIENSFKNNSIAMETEIQKVFYGKNYSDAGIRSAYAQAFYLLNGLRKDIHSGIYFQAISVLLVPYEEKIIYPEKHLKPGNKQAEISLRRCLAFCSKLARNYCFHNYFGTTIERKLALWILMIEVSSILNPMLRRELSTWYTDMEEAILDIKKSKVDYNKNNANIKIQDLLNHLISNNSIDYSKNKVNPTIDFSSKDHYTCVDLIYALGNNTVMNKNGAANIREREEYYGFTLAACIVNHVNEFSDNNFKDIYGEEMCCLYRIALAWVNDYNYPY